MLHGADVRRIRSSELEFEAGLAQQGVRQSRAKQLGAQKGCKYNGPKTAGRLKKRAAHEG